MRILTSLLAALGLTSSAAASDTGAPTPSTADLERKSHIEDIAANPTDEQLQRKARSIARLTDMGVPVSENLPVIADVARSTRRTDQQVAERALAIMITALKGETRDQALTEAVIDQYGAQSLFTEYEQRFLYSTDIPDDIYVQMSWRYESVAVMLWAIGLLDELPPPDQIIDAAQLGAIFRELGADGLYAKAQLRPQSELLDAADMIYRLNWAVTDARVSNADPPRGVHPGIVYERHYALNWLYGYAGLDWDNMKTDT